MCIRDSIQTDTIIHVPDEYYLDYFKKSYRRFVTNLINENGESYDYTVNNNLVFLNDERELVSTMAVSYTHLDVYKRQT